MTDPSVDLQVLLTKVVIVLCCVQHSASMDGLERSWQQERALRLIDMHKLSALTAEVQRATASEAAAEQRVYETDRFIAAAEQHCAEAAATTAAQQQIETQQAGELAAAVDEIQALTLQLMETRKLLLDTRARAQTAKEATKWHRPSLTQQPEGSQLTRGSGTDSLHSQSLTRISRPATHHAVPETSHSAGDHTMAASAFTLSLWY